MLNALNNCYCLPRGKKTKIRVQLKYGRVVTFFTDGWYRSRPTPKNSTTDARFATILKVFKALDAKVNFNVELNKQTLAY